MSEPITIDIQYILQNLCDDCDYEKALSEIVRQVLKPKEIQKAGRSAILPNHKAAYSYEEAASFFIALATEADRAKAPELKMEIGDVTDIILSIWGLIKDGPRGGKKVLRRRYYLDELDKVTPGLIGGSPYAQRSEEDKKGTAHNQRRKELKICSSFSSFFNELTDPMEYIRTATRKFLRRKPDSNNEFEVIYPTFSFQQTATHSIPARCYDLPLPNDWFTGRVKELEEIETVFRNNHRMMILFGIIGIGKTQLALKYVYDHMNEYSFVHWIRAERIEDIIESYRLILEENNKITGAESAETIPQRYADFLAETVQKYVQEHGTAHSDWLIVYDNCGYYTEEAYAAFLRYLPKNLANGHILITTRNNRPIRETPQLEVGPLDLEDATAFLLRRTKLKDEIISDTLAKSLFKNSKDQSAVRRLANQLYRFPLALELAGAYIRATPGCSLLKYLCYLSEGTYVLERNAGITEYDHTILEEIQATLDRIAEDFYDELSKCMKELLYLFAYFNDSYGSSSSYGVDLQIFSYLKPAKEIIHNKYWDQVNQIFAPYVELHAGKGVNEIEDSYLLAAEYCENDMMSDYQGDELKRILVQYGLVRASVSGLLSMDDLVAGILRDDLDCPPGAFILLYLRRALELYIKDGLNEPTDFRRIYRALLQLTDIVDRQNIYEEDRTLKEAARNEWLLLYYYSDAVAMAISLEDYCVSAKEDPSNDFFRRSIDGYYESVKRNIDHCKGLINEGVPDNLNLLDAIIAYVHSSAASCGIELDEEDA